VRLSAVQHWVLEPNVRKNQEDNGATAHNSEDRKSFLFRAFRFGALVVSNVGVAF
jgi:hypothetical protein